MNEGKDKKIIVEESVYQSDHIIGENNVEIMGMDLHNPVFFFSSMLIVLFVILTLGSVDLSRLFLQLFVGYLYKAEPLSCGCST